MIAKAAGLCTPFNVSQNQTGKFFRSDKLHLIDEGCKVFP